MELLELPSRAVLVQRGPSVGYVGPSLANVRLRRGAKAQGYILLHRASHGAWQTFRMSARLVDTARRAAARVARKTRRKVILGELVEVDGSTQVIRSIASFETMSKAELLARATKAAGSVARLVKAKDSDPYDPREFDALVDALARDLNREAVPAFKKTVEKAITSSRIDWASATPRQVHGFSTRLAKKLDASAAAVYRSVGPGLAKTAVGMATSARSSFVKKHNLRVDRAIELKDKAAVTRAAATNAHYIRNFASGQMSESLSSQARDIIQTGINKGESSRVIGKELHRRLSDAAEAQTEAYFRMVASTVQTRAREYSSLRSMQDAGIQVYEWSSVLDEATTEICRWLDGKQFSVDASLERYAAADALEDPTDIKHTMPWFYEKKIQGGSHGGKTGIFMQQAGGLQRVAVVEKSGRGQRDEIGKYSNAKSVKGLQGNGFSPPPAHGGCRSTAIPVLGATLARPATPKPKPAARPKPAAPKPATPNHGIGQFDPSKTKYDNGKLAQALKAEDQAEVREQMAALLHEEGVVPYDHAWNRPEKLMYNSDLKRAGARGVHTWRGQIGLDARAHREAGQFMANAEIGHGDAQRYLNGFNSLVHEAVHGASPMKSSAYRGVGVFAEETSTEAAARHIVLNRFGPKLGFRMEMVKYAGAYSRYITNTVMTMRRVQTGVLDAIGITSRPAAIRKLEESLGRASIQMRAGYVAEANATKTGEKWLEVFSDALSDELTATVATENNLTAAQTKKLSKKMRASMHKEMLSTAKETLK
ncbi:MAG: hypothetical protein GY838_12830 [bacterium]|nr:hypothetical protein [bacterium]